MPHATPKPLSPNPNARHRRREAVMRIFQAEGWGSLELVDEWDGEDLEELRSLLRNSEFETLLDRMSETEER